jgi:ankyrin repeat protein
MSEQQFNTILSPSESVLMLNNDETGQVPSNIEMLELFLRSKLENINELSDLVDNDGNTLLHKAIFYNQYDIVRYLLENYTCLINKPNNRDIYPIHLCVIKDNMQMLRLVARESKKIINKRDSKGLTPAMNAALSGKYECLKYLLDNMNAKWNKLTKNGKFTLLHLAAQSGSLDTFQYLLMKLGPSYLKCRTKEGATVFHLIAARGHDELLNYLLTFKCTPSSTSWTKSLKHSKDITGSTAAHDAAENGNYKCLQLLYDAGLDMFEQDIEGTTPCDLALTSFSIDCREFALSLNNVFNHHHHHHHESIVDIDENANYIMDKTSKSQITTGKIYYFYNLEDSVCLVNYFIQD